MSSVDDAAIKAEEDKIEAAYLETYHKAMQAAYDDALIVQSACNLSGIVFSFARHMETICEEARRVGEGTDFRNRHPIVRLFVTQLVHLAFGETTVDFDKYSKAHDECCKNASKRVLEMLKITEERS